MNTKDFASIIKPWLPPIVLKQLRGVRLFDQINFQGNYSKWSEAKKQSVGYDDNKILDKVRQAARKVKTGEAAFERDSVAFEKPEYRWPLLSSLLYVANLKQQLHVLDFGGSLGSLYFQHKKWFDGIDEIFWGVVEQLHFVDAGKTEFVTKNLDFFFNIEEYIRQKQIPDIVVLSSVLQYLEYPFQILQEIAETGPEFLLIDRTAFIAQDKDRLTIQHVPASIYKASYPAWFFSEKQFIERVESLGYEVFDEFPCDDHVNGWSNFKGFLFKRT